MNKQRSTIYIDKQAYREFKSLCAMLGKSVSEAIEEMIKKELNK